MGEGVAAEILIHFRNCVLYTSLSQELHKQESSFMAYIFLLFYSILNTRFYVW